MLATIGATAPFVGLFGTVWGVYHALMAIGMSGSGASASPFCQMETLPKSLQVSSGHQFDRAWACCRSFAEH